MNNPLFYLFKQMWHYSEGRRKKVILFWGMFIAAGTIHMALTPLVWKTILTTVQEEGVTDGNIWQLMWLLATVPAIVFVFWILHGVARVMELDNAFKVRLSYRSYLLRGVLGLPMEWHTENQSGQTIDKIEKGTGAAYLFASNSFEIVYLLVNLFVCFAALSFVFPLAGLIVSVMMVLSGMIILKLDKILVPQYITLNRAENVINGSIFDAISNIATVCILRVAQPIFKTIISKAEEPYPLFKKNIKLNELKWYLASQCCSLMVVLVIIIYTWKNVGAPKVVLVGEIFLLYRYLDKFGDLFSRFTSMYGDIVQRRAKVTNAQELSSSFVPGTLVNHVLPPAWQQLEINDLDFAYNNGPDGLLHLHNLSLTIRRGQRIALVGESGGGKTTLLKLMRGLYKPSRLTLRVDGVLVEEGFDGIAQAITLIPQDPELFTTTVLQNITIGVPYPMETILRFTDMACITDTIMRLPHGFESQTKEKGVSLSGGQRQRLALARGLLACDEPNKTIILVDEPTASLDAATERQVYENILNGFPQAVILSSIHRLHLLPLFDLIYVFDQGRIVSCGSFEEILHQCPVFQGLWNKYNEKRSED